MQRRGLTTTIVLAVALLAIAAWAVKPDPHAGHAGHAGHDEPVVAPAAEVPPARRTQAPTKAPAKAPPEESRVPVEVSAVQQQRVGLRSARLERRDVEERIRAVGRIIADERREQHVHSRVAGHIEDIAVAAVGDRVRRGQVLYRLYSPELLSTQREYLAARERGQLGRELAAAALARLELWDVASSEIEALKERGTPKRALAFTAPVSGVVMERRAVRGMYVTPDLELYRLNDLSRVVLLLSLYEHEIPLIALGDEVAIEVQGRPGAALEGTITYLFPELDATTRTGQARVEVANRDGMLRPGMYATASVKKPLGAQLLVPLDAVIDTGLRKLVFVREGETRFTPREVTLGPRAGSAYVVLAGVVEGEEVVVRASFLIDAESRLQAALATGAPAPGHAGH